jgi:glycerol-3-phosphate acyltransferase PlsY
VIQINFTTSLIILLSYLIGTFHAGYIIIKLIYRKDITAEGSGNVGTLNAFKISGSKLAGSAVLFFDFIKGFLPIFFLSNSGYSPELVYLSSICIVTGHNFPIWLKFKGGRGLATAAGIFLYLNLFLLISWSVFWLIIFWFKKDVLISNFVATFTIPFMAYIIKSSGMIVLSLSSISIDFKFIVFTLVITFLILLKHQEVFKLIPLKIFQS